MKAIVDIFSFIATPIIWALITIFVVIIAIPITLIVVILAIGFLLQFLTFWKKSTRDKFKESVTEIKEEVIKAWREGKEGKKDEEHT